MELLRIAAIVLILCLHVNYTAIGRPTEFEVVNSPFSSFFRILFEHICIPGVNVFVLLSGWFGINCTLSGGVKLAFQVLFISILVTITCLAIGIECPKEDVLSSLYAGNMYWFVVAYIGLYVLAPVLNAFIADSSQKQVCIFLCGFFAIEFLWGWLLGNDIWKDGYSIVSFIGLYLLAKYVRVWQMSQNRFNSFTYVVLYVFIAILTSVWSYVSIRHFDGCASSMMISYCSPFVIAQSLCLVLLFSRFKWSSRIVNRLAMSCFTIYLVHTHILVFPAYILKAYDIWCGHSGVKYLIAISAYILIVSFASILLDQARIAIWSVISDKIRKH